MKKKWKIMICIILVFLSVYLPIKNLYKYSPYYVKNYEHKEGMEPVLMTLANNLDYIRPDELKDISYDYDGWPTISNSRRIGGKPQKHRAFKRTSEGYTFIDGEKIYILNMDFKISSEGDMDFKNSINREKVVAEIYDTVDPVLKSIGEPTINLQFLYDLLHKDDFK